MLFKVVRRIPGIYISLWETGDGVATYSVLLGEAGGRLVIFFLIDSFFLNTFLVLLRVCVCVSVCACKCVLSASVEARRECLDH